MSEIENNITDKKLRLIVRLGRSNMTFSVGDPQENGVLAYEPYEMNMGISMAANLREALKTSELLQSGYKRVLVQMDSPVMLMPVDEYKTQDVETLYYHTFHHKGNEEVLAHQLMELNVMVVFSINKDLKLVIDDHFEDIRIQPLMCPVWTHLYRRTYASVRRKLYAYFHEKRMEVFSFQQNRFRFANTYKIVNAHDALYYLLYIWKLMGMDAQQDELLLIGDMPQAELLTDELAKYLRFYKVVNQADDFAQHHVLAERKDIPYDIKAIYLD